MIINSLQDNLKNGFNTVGHIAGKNINLPILNNVLIEARDGNIKLVSTDLEIGITKIIRGKIEKEGVLTVDSKIISEYINLLPNKKINIEKKETNLLLKCDNYKTIIKSQEAEEYPLIPQINKEIFFKVNAEEFKEALRQVIFAVSNSETRAELSGIFFNFINNELFLVATDSYRLAEKKIKIETNAKENLKIIVPAKTLQELARILTNVKNEEMEIEKKEIIFYINENQILFSISNTELISRLIEGQYPDYKQIIPTNSVTQSLVNREELIRAVKASAIFSKSGINDINLDFPEQKNKIIISAASSQTGENTTNINANSSGKDNSIVVNYRYLLDGLNNINSEMVIIEIIDNNTPCVLKAENDNSYFYIIMPIKQ